MVSSLTDGYSGPNPCLVQFYYFSSALAPQDSTLPTPAVSEHNRYSCILQDTGESPTVGDEYPASEGDTLLNTKLPV